MARMTLDELAKLPLNIDRDRLLATSEDEIRQQMVEDRDDPDAPICGFQEVYPPALIRQQLGMTQEAFAGALCIPLATLRNWEQGRTRPDPAAQSLLRAVAKNPKAVLAAIAA